MKKLSVNIPALLLLMALSTGSFAQEKKVIIKGTIIGDTRGYNRIDMYTQSGPVRFYDSCQQYFFSRSTF